MSRPIPGRSRADQTSPDLVRLYLKDIGRFELLKPDEELILARQVQQRLQLLNRRRQRQGEDPQLADLTTLEQLPGQALNGEQRQRLQAIRTHWAGLEGLTPAQLLQALRQGQRSQPAPSSRLQRVARRLLAPAEKARRQLAEQRGWS